MYMLCMYNAQKWSVVQDGNTVRIHDKDREFLYANGDEVLLSEYISDSIIAVESSEW